MKKVHVISFTLILVNVSAQNYDFAQYKLLNNLPYKLNSLGEFSSAIIYYDSMFITIDFYHFDKLKDYKRKLRPELSPNTRRFQ